MFYSNKQHDIIQDEYKIKRDRKSIIVDIG